MGSPLINAATFLIQTLFGLYILVVMLRFLLQWVRADFYNPLTQFLVKVTNPPLVPLRRIIPGFGGIDLAAVVLMVALQALELGLVGLVHGYWIQPAGLAVLGAAYLLQLLLNIYFFSILILVILSWVSPGGYNPAVGLLVRLTEPIMRPARRLIPPISGLDLSPIVVVIALQLVSILLITPLIDLGQGLAVG